LLKGEIKKNKQKEEKNIITVNSVLWVWLIIINNFVTNEVLYQNLNLFC
jgi:hypothetical protein